MLAFKSIVVMELITENSHNVEHSLRCLMVCYIHHLEGNESPLVDTVANDSSCLCSIEIDVSPG